MIQDSDLGAARARLVEDFGKVVADTEALLRSLADAGGEKTAAIRSAAEANLKSAKARLQELQDTVAEKASGVAREADTYVHENPWTAVGIAAAAGLILGMVIGNRR